VEEKREHTRFSVQLRARYLKENEEEWNECTVTNISRKGIGIIMYVREIIPVDSSLQLEIIIPTKKEPIKVTAILKWIVEQKGGKNFMGGVGFTKALDEVEWKNLIYFMS
jgi:hypothetical protein